MGNKGSSSSGKSGGAAGGSKVNPQAEQAAKYRAEGDKLYDEFMDTRAEIDKVYEKRSEITDKMNRLSPDDPRYNQYKKQLENADSNIKSLEFKAERLYANYSEEYRKAAELGG